MWPKNPGIFSWITVVKEPDGEAKRQRFEQALANLHACQPDSVVYPYRQGDLDAVPGNPWVYWITRPLRELFTTLLNLDDIAQPRVGLQTGDNSRFLRFWWEVGKAHIALGCCDTTQA